MEFYLNETNALVINHDEKWFTVIPMTEIGEYIDVDDEDLNPDSMDAADLYVQDIYDVIWPLEEQGYKDKDDM